MLNVLMQLFHQILSTTGLDVLYTTDNIHRRELIHLMSLYIGKELNFRNKHCLICLLSKLKKLKLSLRESGKSYKHRLNIHLFYLT